MEPSFVHQPCQTIEVLDKGEKPRQAVRAAQIKVERRQGECKIDDAAAGAARSRQSAIKSIRLFRAF